MSKGVETNQRHLRFRAKCMFAPSVFCHYTKGFLAVEHISKVFCFFLVDFEGQSMLKHEAWFLYAQRILL